MLIGNCDHCGKAVHVPSTKRADGSFGHRWEQSPVTNEPCKRGRQHVVTIRERAGARWSNDSAKAPTTRGTFKMPADVGAAWRRACDAARARLAREAEEKAA